MHLLERYATSCGVKIGKPYIYEQFFPVTEDKYISFQPFSKYGSKNYDYWDEVVNLIQPYLEKQNIKLIQIGANEDRKVVGCLNVCGQTNVPQAAYIIKNAIMHIGADSFAAHIASGYGKKIVTLYSNNNIENVKPYWSNNNDVSLISPKVNRKPQYSVDEFPKSINEIKPEQIAESILQKLNIEHNHLPETVFIGKEYISKTLEIIPDTLIDTNQINIDTLIIRMDYIFNEQVLHHFVQTKKCIIFTNKPINIELLKAYKQNIAQLIYIVEEDNDFNFIKELKTNVINYQMISWLSEEDLNKYKLNYMDYGLIFRKEYPTVDFQLKDNLHYKSSRILLSAKGQFGTKYQWQNDIKDSKLGNNQELLKEIGNLYIFSID